MDGTEQVEQADVEPLWLSYSQAQKLSSLERTTSLMLINDPSSGVKAARVGRSVRLSRRSLEEYMEDQAKEFE